MLCRRNFLCGLYTSLYGCGGCSSARFNSGCISSTAAAAAAAAGATTAAGFPAAGGADAGEDDEDEGGQAFSAFSAFSFFSALLLASSSVDDDLGLEQTLVFVLWDPCEVPALGESIPESLGESNLRTLCFVTVAAAVPVAATLDSSAVGAAATRLRDTVVTVAADEAAEFTAAAAAAAA